MNILLSSQVNGGLRVVRIKADKEKNLTLAPKHEFCCEGKENYIQKIISFEFQEKSYLGLARKSGLVQLYEDVAEKPTKFETQKSGKPRKSYKLYKDWKHSNMNPRDQIIDIGFIDNRYLYSCSNEGKLIFRDLINDDANESYMVFLIQKPVNCFTIRCVEDEYGVSTGSFTIACAGKNNELKLYKICMEKQNERDELFGHRLDRGSFHTEDNEDNNVVDTEYRIDEETDEGDDDDLAEHDGEDDEGVDSDVDEVVLISFHPGSPIVEFSRSSRFINSTVSNSSSRRIITTTVNNNNSSNNSSNPGTLPFQSFSSRPHYSELIRRRVTSLNLQATHSVNSLPFSMPPSFNERKVRTLIPNWTSRTSYKDYIYSASLADKVFNWFVSIAFIPNKPDIILCGTQFGEIFVYNITRSRFPIKRISLSKFGIIKLEIFNNQNCQYVAYTDSMSKIGILNMNTLQEVNSYEGINMGPISSSLFVFPPSSVNSNPNKVKRKLHKLSSSSNFEPIIFITSTIDGKLSVYKLYNDNSKVLISEMKSDSLIPSICFNGGDINDRHVYEMLSNEGVSATNFAGNANSSPVSIERSKIQHGREDENHRDMSADGEIEDDEEGGDDEEEIFEKGFKKRHNSNGSHDLDELVEINEYMVKKPSPLRYELSDHKSGTLISDRI